MNRRGKRNPSARGFTLLELAVVLLLIAVVTASGVVIFTASLQANQYNITVARMDAIEQALLDFAAANYRIPCPSSLTIAQGASYYGMEAGASGANTTGTCHGGTPASTHTSTSGVEEGGVPTRALQLPDAYMYDGWNHRFRYAVDPSVTTTGTLPTNVNGPCTASTSSVTVNDATGAVRTSAAIYAIVSHGANGHGSYTSNGVIVDAGSTNTNELANCNCGNSGVYNGTYVPTYVQMAPTQDPTSTTDNFDDIVTYKEIWQLQRSNFALATPACPYVYVADSGNNRVQKFDPRGNFMFAFGTGYKGVGGTIGGTGSAGGEFNDTSPSSKGSYIYIDSSYNVWVSDENNSRVQEFDFNGNYKGSFGTGTSGNGTIGFPGGVAQDGSGNFWVGDTASRYRIVEYNSSGVWQRQSPVNPASSGTCTGNFTQPTDLAIDSSNNVWVTDLSAACVTKINSSGSYVTNFSTGGSATSGIFIDSSSNFWVGDPTLHRIYTFSNTGTARNIFSSTDYFGGSGSSNGLFGASSPQGIAVDSSGNIWAADTGNNRIEEFNSSGTYIFGIGAGYNGVTGSQGSSGNGNGQFNGPTSVYLGYE